MHTITTTRFSWLRSTLRMALILTMCSIAGDAPARLPRPYESHGVVRSVDVANRRLCLEETPKPRFTRSRFNSRQTTAGYVMPGLSAPLP